MTIPKQILEWRKTHPRTLEEQARATKTLEELKESWINSLDNLDRAIKEMKSHENK